MNRLVVSALVLGIVLSAPVGILWASEQTQTQNQSQAQTQTQTKSQAGDCVCDGPNCDGDCPQNSYQTQSGNAYQGDLSESFQYFYNLMLKLFFGGGE